MAKHRFRKAYIICINNEIIGEYEVTNLYKSRKYADGICQSKQRTEMESVKMEWKKNSNSTPTQYRVHGFYLVHESLFDEILKDYCKEVKA